MSENDVKRVASDNGLTEGALVRRAQAGDPAAFGELVARYQDRVYNTCYRLCRNHADAADLTQTAFLKAFEALARFDARARFYTWLFRIAVNLVHTQRRQQARRHTVSLSASSDEERDMDPAARDAEPVDGPAQRQETHTRVEAALLKLDEDFRAAVVLKDVEGMDYHAISEVLEIPLGTVKSRIFRGRLLLRQMLTGEGIELDAV